MLNYNYILLSYKQNALPCLLTDHNSTVLLLADLDPSPNTIVGDFKDNFIPQLPVRLTI
jgi:hypothetical protein